MNKLNIAMAVVAAGFCAGAARAAEKAEAAKGAPAPQEVRLMIASFGTIESQTKVEKWLGEQVQKAEKPKALDGSAAEKATSADMQREIVSFNWHTRKAEFVRESSEADKINAENMRMLRALQMKVLSDEETRYVPVAKDYLQASLFKKGGKLVKVVDRGNIDMAFVEQKLQDSAGKDLKVSGASCILTATYGDFEKDEKVITLNGKGTKIRRTTYTQPYAGKIRGLAGDVLCAFSGTAVVGEESDNVVESVSAAPNRKLIEKIAEQIADEVIAFFTTDLKFAVKAPQGLDPDDVVIRIDGREVDPEGLRVVSANHRLTAELEGCDTLVKDIEIETATPVKTVRIKLVKEQPKAKADKEGAE